ncbi:MAG: 5-(carboxyamino)imidazole ribonucleotide mutase [Caldiserica bacterium]|nr:5-(carboxyamino)imidazole ribonucleotide mutase [Caldisericota bacterium]
MENIQVCIMLGSKSDLEVCQKANDVFDKLGISYEVVISSAHRTPDRTAEIAKALEGRGVKAVICMAGYAAHLPGVVAAYTKLPVIAVPLAGSPLNGLDALYAQQMPAGVPVACMTIGAAGATNAALFCARMFATTDPDISKKLAGYIEDMKQKVIESSLQK